MFSSIAVSIDTASCPSLSCSMFKVVSGSRTFARTGAHGLNMAISFDRSAWSQEIDLRPYKETF
jgi:hypothetical protein